MFVIPVLLSASHVATTERLEFLQGQRFRFLCCYHKLCHIDVKRLSGVLLFKDLIMRDHCKRHTQLRLLMHCADFVPIKIPGATALANASKAEKQ